MTQHPFRHLTAISVAVGLAASSAFAQAGQDEHARHLAAARSSAITQAGQSAFAAMAEIVRILEADPATDWTRVDIEALRAHLVDMDDVTLRAKASVRQVAGGAQFDVSGPGKVGEAIGRVVTEHARALDRLEAFRATAEPVANGVRLTVTAERADDVATVARIRALGFAGLLVTDEHHAAHHLAIARGEGKKAHIH